MRNSLKLCLLGLTPLHEAANFGFPATTKILLKHGANIDATTKSDCAFKSDGVDENTVGPITALQDACSTLAGELLEGERSRKLEVIQILLEYNANTLLRNAQNKTPLQAGFITVKFLYNKNYVSQPDNSVSTNKNKLYSSNQKKWKKRPRLVDFQKKKKRLYSPQKKQLCFKK